MTAEGKNDFTSIRAKNYSVNVSNFTTTKTHERKQNGPIIFRQTSKKCLE